MSDLPFNAESLPCIECVELTLTKGGIFYAGVGIDSATWSMGSLRSEDIVTLEMVDNPTNSKSKLVYLGLRRSPFNSRYACRMTEEQFRDIHNFTFGAYPAFSFKEALALPSCTTQFKLSDDYIYFASGDEVGNAAAIGALRISELHAMRVYGYKKDVTKGVIRLRVRESNTTYRFWATEPQVRDIHKRLFGIVPIVTFKGIAEYAN